MRVWVQECWTQARRNTVVHTYGGDLDGDGSDHTTRLTLKSTPTKMIPILHAPGWALQPTKVVFQLSQANFDAAGYLDFTKRIDAVGQGTFMRFETEGVATEDHWSNELQKSPFAKFVFRETTGANRRNRRFRYNVAFRV